MSREKINLEMKEALGQVPTFFQEMPESALSGEWALFQRSVLRDDTSIPPKYKELIGVAVASAMQCWYCSNVHMGVAGLHGATGEEMQEATLLAKFAAGWSAYFNGTLYDKDTFMKELSEIGGYLMDKNN